MGVRTLSAAEGIAAGPGSTHAPFMDDHGNLLRR
jgi:hypothetical protein